MPFRNAEAFLRESIESILNQSYSDFEFIIIDDASTDESEKIIKRYLFDPRIIYIKNTERIGIAKNLNKGLSIARGEIIARMDGDDISTPDRLEKQYLYLSKNPALSLVGTFAIIINESNIELASIEFPIEPHVISKLYFFHYPFLHPTIMFRKSDVLEIGAYRDDKDYIEDVDMFLRFIMAGKQGANLPEYLYKYRKHKNSTDQYFKIKTKLMFQSRMEYLRKYSPPNKIGMYAYTLLSFLLDSFINAEQKNYFFNFIKKTKLWARVSC